MFFTACKFEKEKPPPTTEEVVNILTEYTLISKIYSDSFHSANDAGKKSDDSVDGIKGNRSGYPIISITPLDATTWPKQITVDYGNENHLGIDGRYRRGIIQIEISDFYRNYGSIMTITYNNFHQNDYKVEGIQTITNNGLNSYNHLVYTVVVNDGHIITSEGFHIYFEQTCTREWVAGESTPLQICDDIYYIEGVQSGISSDGIEYTLTTETPLDVLSCCKWVRNGILNIDIQGLSNMSIDFSYGTGDCDNKSSLLFNGNIYPITME